MAKQRKTQNPTRTATLQYRGYTTREGYAAFSDALSIFGELQNSLVTQRRYMAGDHRHGKERLRHQNASITDLHRNDARYTPFARRLLGNVAKRINTAWRRAYADPDAGYPDTHSPHNFRTLEISEPSVQHLKATSDGRTEVHIKGLPTIWFHPDHRMPNDQQPRSIAITKHGRKITLSLVYNLLPLQYSKPRYQSCGSDCGVVNRLTVVNDQQQYYEVPPTKTRDHRKTVRRIKRGMQRCRDAAIKNKRARWTNQKRPDGSTKRRFRWHGIPSRKYRILRDQLRNVEHQRNVRFRNQEHRITSTIVKDHHIVAVEDLKVKNMTKSNSGTVEQHGKNVAQKRSLNREILAQRWGSLRRQLEYKCTWQSRYFAAVPAQYTSQTCISCGHVAKGNRVSRDTFRCQNCRWRCKADVVGGENVRCRGVRAAAGGGDLAPANHRSPRAPSRQRGTSPAYAAQLPLLLFTKLPLLESSGIS